MISVGKLGRLGDVQKTFQLFRPKLKGRQTAVKYISGWQWNRTARARTPVIPEATPQVHYPPNGLNRSRGTGGQWSERVRE